MKRWRRGDPAVVRIETKKYGPGDESVVICALWGDNSLMRRAPLRIARRQPQGSAHAQQRRDRRISRDSCRNGVNVGANTVNGDVVVDGATADVDAATVNGEVDSRRPAAARAART